MTSPSTTVAREFTGSLAVGSETVPAALQYQNGHVSLHVAGEAIGAWPTSEVDVVASDHGYDVQAEGDSVKFLPDQPDAFASFLENGAAPDLPVEEPEPPSYVARVEPPPLARREDAVPEVTETAAKSPFEDEIDFHSLFSSEPEEIQSEEAPGLEWDDAPDEYFAAGFQGPSSEAAGPVFRSPLVATENERESADEAEPEWETPTRSASDADDDPEAEADSSGPVIDPFLEVEQASTTELDESPTYESLSDVDSEPDSSPAIHEPGFETPNEPLPGANGHAPAEPERAESPVDEEPPTRGRLSELLRQARSGGHETDDDPADGASKSALTRLLALGRGATVTTETEAGDDDAEHLPEPMSDRDNLRQWALVVAGGAVVVLIVGVVAWGLIALLGGDSEAPATDPEPAVTSQPAPPPTVAVTTTAPAPSTTVSAENTAMASAFVTTWNELAREYAYHLSIAGDTLPLSTAPAPTVHLTYGEDGSLLLTMAPKGTGTDRDLLLAMGLAVAWADPSLSPEGRRDLLSAVGVDIDEPSVADMGGDLTRNGVDYSLQVVDGVIRFEVTPQNV